MQGQGYAPQFNGQAVSYNRPQLIIATHSEQISILLRIAHSRSDAHTVYYKHG